LSLRENLTRDTVSQLRAGDVVCAADDDSIAAAVALMRRHRTGCVLVCTENRLVGIFTERDVMRIIAEGGDLTAPVATVMTAKPATISPSATVAEAVIQMHRGGYRRLPVVDQDGTPMSVLKLRSVVHYLVEHFPSAVYNLPPVSQPTTKDREGA
jgi:CBS domain-containing protein